MAAPKNEASNVESEKRLLPFFLGLKN